MRQLVSIGDRFGRWVVIAAAPPAAYQRQGRQERLTRWLCRCDCGTERVVQQGELRRSRKPSRSCGCVAREMLIAANTTHGLARTLEYKIWVGIKSRCGNSKDKRFAHYGGRGIKVCERWLDFESFYADMGPKPGPRFSIERIDNDGDYSPTNCKWIPLSEQNRNRQCTPRYTIGGETRTLMEWVEVYGANYERVSSRLRHLGWDIVTALTAPKLNSRGKPVAEAN